MDFDVNVNVTSDSKLQGAYGKTLLQSISSNGGLSVGGDTKTIKSTPLLIISDTAGQTANEGNFTYL